MKKIIPTFLVVALMCAVMVVPAYAADYIDDGDYILEFEDGTIVDTAELPEYLLEAGATYTLVCDYEITASNGETIYIPSMFVEEERWSVVYAYKMNGGTQIIASSAINPPYVRYDASGYYQTWLKWTANVSGVDTYVFTPATTAGEVIEYTMSSGEMSTSGSAVSTALGYDCVYWSNYDVLDGDGNIVHYSDYVAPDTPDDELGGSVTVDMTETNEILGVIQSQLWIILVVGLLGYVYKFFRLFF